MSLKNERDVEFLEAFLSSQPAQDLLKEEGLILDGKLANYDKRYIRLTLKQDCPSEDALYRDGLYERYLQDYQLHPIYESYDSKLILRYRHFPWINPYFKVVFDERPKFKSVDSRPVFYKVGEDGISADRPEVCFVSTFGNHPANEHIFQASYYAGPAKLRPKGKLAYLAYSHPLLRNPSNSDPNQGIVERVFTRGWDGRKIRIGSNVDGYTIQLADTGLIRFETQGYDIAEKAIMLCTDSIDVDKIEELIVAERDEWRSELSRKLWPVTYYVRPNT